MTNEMLRSGVKEDDVLSCSCKAPLGSFKTKTQAMKEDQLHHHPQ